MRDDERLEHLPGQLYPVSGNTRLLCDEPDTMWVVRSGSLALFATAVKDGAPEGVRRALGSAGPGTVLIGNARDPQGRPHSLLATAVETTQLLKLFPASAVLSKSLDIARVVALVESSISTLDALLGRVAAPEMQVQVT